MDNGEIQRTYSYQKVDDRIRTQLNAIFTDRDRVMFDTTNLMCYAYDASFGRYLPEAVVQPLTADEVSAVVQLAVKARIPVYPRGQSTSLSGGPLPVEGGIVIDLSRMNQKLEIMKDDLIAQVSPGVITDHIHQAAEQVGLMYPPDPSSSSICTIGGNLAENAGGPRGLKYGVTKDYVLGLEVVTPEGQVIRTGGRTVKNVTGYDLTKLIIGSEGTLGIITEATLQLIPKPPATGTLMVIFDDLVNSGETISTILTSGILPAKLEIVDQACIQAVEAYEPTGLPLDAEAIILIEVDGRPSAVEEELVEIAEICRRKGARSVKIARTPEESLKLWRARKMVSPAIARIHPTKISEDICVPRSQIPQMFAKIKEIRERTGLFLVVFGHAGDGNLHPNIMTDERNEAEMRKVEQAVSEIFEYAVALGGTLSGEHGIGTMKSPFMHLELGEDSLDFMQRIKESWDPHHIMNPGKIFPKPGQTFRLTN